MAGLNPRIEASSVRSTGGLRLIMDNGHKLAVQMNTTHTASHPPIQAFSGPGTNDELLQPLVILRILLRQFSRPDSDLRSEKLLNGFAAPAQGNNQVR
jgi:hypothetical protein